MSLFNSAFGIILIALCGVVFGFEGVTEYEDIFIFELQSKKQYHNGRIVTFSRNMSFQLGKLIVSNSKDKQHEYGHYKQEEILGIIYIPLMGLTSLYGNIIINDPEVYYNLWSEKWADQLGR